MMGYNPYEEFDQFDNEIRASLWQNGAWKPSVPL